MNKSRYIFFYGTLQPGGNLRFFELNNLGEKITFVKNIEIKGDLFHLKNRELNIEYPGVTNLTTSKNTVYGSLFKINDTSVFKILDEHEGYNPNLKANDSQKINFYNREKISFILNNESTIIELYTLNTNSNKYNSNIIENKGLVKSGDWLKHIMK